MENQDTYLADWFEDRLTDEALQQIISKEEFLHYQKIKHALSGHELKTPEVKSHFELIKHKLQQQPEMTTRVIPLWKYISAAASVLVFFTIGMYLFKSNTVSTDYGQKQSITLADNSRVHLEARSSLSYTNLFKYNRNLSLHGEAYFEVAKGSTFTVNTPQGTVTVLGTKFNVIASASYFEVHCDEGKVSVTTAHQSIILTPGKSVGFYRNKVTAWDQEIKSNRGPAERESSFFRTPAEVVFEKIENEYGIKINYPENVKSTSFTGAISQIDIHKAMQSICLPLHLKYRQLSPDKIEVTNE